MGPPLIGKTGPALATALRIAHGGRRVGLFGLEMRPFTDLQRFLSMETQKYVRLRTGRVTIQELKGTVKLLGKLDEETWSTGNQGEERPLLILATQPLGGWLPHSRPGIGAYVLCGTLLP
jgi:hypothetical protein